MATESGVDDTRFEVSVYSPVCLFCRHLQDADPDKRCCAAFKKPGSIPLDIWNGDNEHTEPVEGDGGVLFEAGKRAEG